MSETILAATRKGLFPITRRGTAWKIGAPAFPGEPVTQVLKTPGDGTLFAALRLGHFGVKLHRSEDDGASWTEVAAPAFPEGIEDAPGKPAPAVDMVWSLAAGPAEGEIWAGTTPGGLFASRDRGESWALNENLWTVPGRAEWFGGGYDLPGIHTILFDPRDPRRITIAVSCAGVWKSDDGGASWRSAGRGLRNAYLPPERAYETTGQDPHRLAACPADPDVVWCQHHNGIFHSTDGAETFSEITDVAPSVFGFPVVAHPADSGTAWFVPAVKDVCRVPVDARLVVTRTRDGGKTFESLSDGLPQADCYDLVYRHGLDIDETGDRLALGSTTGGLWVGEDGGERWSLVSAHLPPIYQVAFV